LIFWQRIILWLVLEYGTKLTMQFFHDGKDLVSYNDEPLETLHSRLWVSIFAQKRSLAQKLEIWLRFAEMLVHFWMFNKLKIGHIRRVVWNDPLWHYILNSKHESLTMNLFNIPWASAITGDSDVNEFGNGNNGNSGVQNDT